MRIHKLALLLSCLAALSGASTAWAQFPDVPVAQERVVSRDEFYYYDERKLRKPLTLSRSVAVKLRISKVPEERTPYLKSLGPITVREIAQLYQRAEYALDFIPTLNQDARAVTVKRLAAEQDLEVAPIFTVDGMDAVVDGIYLQTVTPMSRETVVRALEKQFGSDIGIHEVTPFEGVWHVSFRRLFFLDGEKLPLTALSVANLIQTSDAFLWVKRAYPKFAFLSPPVIPSISVYPLSGTVGQEREVVIGFRIFGKTDRDVVIEESDIPEFMQGLFVPQAGGRPPQPSFIEVFGAPKKEKLRQVGPNEWYFEHRYVFGMYAPEPDWSFPSFTIPYTYRGARQEMTILSTTFFVRPHLDEKVSINDIPRAYQLPVGNFPGFSMAQPTPLHAWFDGVAQWLGGRGNVTLVAKIVLGTSTLIALLFVGVLVRRGYAWTRSRAVRLGIEGDRLAVLLKKAEAEPDNQKSLQAYHKVLSEVLHAWDPQFPRGNVTYQDVRVRLGAIRSGAFLHDLENTVGLEDLFDEIESRNDPTFEKRDENQLKALGTNLRLKIEKLADELSAQENTEHKKRRK